VYIYVERERKKIAYWEVERKRRGLKAIRVCGRNCMRSSYGICESGEVHGFGINDSNSNSNVNVTEAEQRGRR